MDANNFYGGIRTRESGHLIGQELYMSHPKRGDVFRDRTESQYLEPRSQVKYGTKQLYAENELPGIQMNSKQHLEGIYQNIFKEQRGSTKFPNVIHKEISQELVDSKKNPMANFEKQRSNIPKGQRFFDNNEEDFEPGKLYGNSDIYNRKIYENLPTSVLKGIKQIYNDNPKTHKTDSTIEENKTHSSRRRRKSSQGNMDEPLPSNHSSKTLLPKIYSDDMDLYNPKPMTGGEINTDRLYDTVPLVAKTCVRPSIQDLESTMTHRVFDMQLHGIQGDGEEMYATVHKHGEHYHKDDNTLADENFEKYERPKLKTERRHRQGRRAVDTNSIETTSDYLEPLHTNSNETNRENMLKEQKELNYYSRSQREQRPNYLFLPSNNQDLLNPPGSDGHSQERDFRTKEYEDIEEKNNKMTRQGSDSSSSSVSYCSIQSPVDQIWNHPATPDSTSSSPIIWNFSHFYFERKVE